MPMGLPGVGRAVRAVLANRGFRADWRAVETIPTRAPRRRNRGVCWGSPSAFWPVAFTRSPLPLFVAAHCHGETEFWGHPDPGGIVSRDQLNEAEQMAREQNSNAADCLVKLGYATGKEVMRAMAEHHGMEFVDLTELTIPEK